MPGQIHEIITANGKRIFVEVAVGTDDVPSTILPDDLPPGAEPTGVVERAANTISLLQDSISGMAEGVYQALQHLRPHEWTLEMHVGFKGTANPIPFITTTEAEGGLKITVTWRGE